MTSPNQHNINVHVAELDTCPVTVEAPQFLSSKQSIWDKSFVLKGRPTGNLPE